jgi:hypothetical protein
MVGFEKAGRVSQGNFTLAARRIGREPLDSSGSHCSANRYGLAILIDSFHFWLINKYPLNKRKRPRNRIYSARARHAMMIAEEGLSWQSMNMGRG